MILSFIVVIIIRDGYHRHNREIIATLHGQVWIPTYVGMTSGTALSFRIPPEERDGIQT